MSDLHLEVHPDYRPAPAPGADLLVLAGDIGSYQVGGRLTRTLHMIGNAHIDPVWLWQWPEGYQEVRATFRSAIDRSVLRSARAFAVPDAPIASPSRNRSSSPT